MSCRFVAEVGSNHNADLDRALAFVDRAATAGFDAVKFQAFRVQRLFAPEILERSAAHRGRVAQELPLAWLPDLAAACKSHGLVLGCSVFDVDTAADVAPHVQFVKVSSYELLCHALVRVCATSGKPTLISTGMATLEEVGTAVEAFRAAGGDALALLHCVSCYPAAPEDSNLAAIGVLRDAFGVACGWSDHTTDPATVLRAVRRWRSDWVEMHVDLDGRGAEFAPGHCWLPDAAADVIHAARVGSGDDAAAASALDGDARKGPAASERDARLWRADPADGMRPHGTIRAMWRPA